LYKHPNYNDRWQHTSTSYICYGILKKYIKVPDLLELLLEFIIEFKRGDIVDAQDSLGEWYTSVVIYMYRGCAEVSFIGFSAIYQEIITVDRIRQHGIMTKQKIYITADFKKYLLSEICIGDFIYQFIPFTIWKKICNSSENIAVSHILQGKVVCIDPYIIEQGNGIYKNIFEIYNNGEMWHILKLQEDHVNYVCPLCSMINPLTIKYCRTCSTPFTYCRNLLR